MLNLAICSKSWLYRSPAAIAMLPSRSCAMQWKGMKLLKYLVSVSRLIYEQVIRYLKGICIKVYFLICEPSLPEIKPIVPVGYLNWLDNDTKCSYGISSAVQEV
ncbi:hypothetical protein C2S51_034680 [Perilla frutescens var. frutescens]|nr:hypothetical protein C2S51_034680 [Perilla frutescens var. frutescens]